MNTPQNQSSAPAAETLIKQIVDWGVADEKPGEYKLMRFKFGNAPQSDVLSQNQPPFIAQLWRGEDDAKIPVCSMVVSSFDLKWSWARSEYFGPDDILRRFNDLSVSILNAVKKLTNGKTTICEVTTGHGEVTLANIEELFLFAYLPAELESFQNEQDRLQGLSKWVLDFLKLEKQEQLEKIKAEAQARAVEQLKKFPRRMPHESPEIDHYKNRTEVELDLLRKEWPEFFAAMDNLKLAKTEIELADWRKRVVIGYQADHKALYGTIPEARQTDAAEFSRDDYYIRLMHEAMNAPQCRVPKIYWQLVGGWIEKNYYQMNENQLGTAFNRDWNYTRPFRGGTLARYARKIGLQSALKRGRKS